MQWHQDIQTHLNDNNYQLVLQFYEQLIENNSPVIEDYFYLGLAYLLQSNVNCGRLLCPDCHLNAHL